MKSNLPTFWDLKPLSEVCTLNPRKSEVKDLPDDKKITFLSMESVGEDGEIYSSKIKTLGEVFKGYTYFKKNDVLFAKITPCMENGKGAIADIDTEIGFGSTEFHVLRPKSNVLPEWIYLFLASKSIRKLAEMKMTGSAGQKRVPKSFFDKTKIPLPPLKIQQKIVEILEKAEKLKEWRAEADVLIDEYLKSVFLEMFGDLGSNKKGWEEYQLKKICKFIDYRGKTPTKTDYGVRLITAKNVKKGYISLVPAEYIAEKDYLSWMRRGFPKEGDILFTTEAPLGNVAKLGKFDKIALAQRIITLSCNKGVDSNYLTYALLSDNIQKRILKYSTGSTATGIRSKELKKVLVPIPPIHLQNQFAETVKKVEQIKAQQKQSKQQIDNLFNALMQKAFKGELKC